MTGATGVVGLLGPGAGELLTGPAAEDGYAGIGGTVPFFGGGPPHSQSSSPVEMSAGVLGVVLFLPAGAGGIENLDPETGYAVPLDAHAASPASVDDW